MSERQQTSEPQSPILYIFVAVVAALSLVGFVSGTSVKGESLHTARTRGPEAKPRDVPPARSYAELRDSARGEGSGWQQALQVSGNQAAPGSKLPGDLARALQERERNRAYDGAPPTIPHAIAQSGPSECLACHAEGLRLGQRQAGLLPHDAFTSCTQCHVTQLAPMPGAPPAQAGPWPVPNRFAGARPVQRGARAYPIAPPQIPHTSFMRGQCLSCHGPTGSAAMRTPHDERSSCTQCHVDSAQESLRPGPPVPPGGLP